MTTLQTCPPHLSAVATLPWEIQKVIFQHHYSYTSDYLRYTYTHRVVSVLDSGAEGPGFKLQSQRCRVTVLGKLFTPIVPLFNKQQNW